MANDDETKPKLPPPPVVGESADSTAPRIAPPKVAGKAEARAVGLDTSFIDGLTAGLMEDPLPGAESKASSASNAAAKDAEDPASDDASSSDKGDEPRDDPAEAPADDDVFEQLPTRALSAMTEDGEIAPPLPGEDGEKDTSDGVDDADAPSPAPSRVAEPAVSGSIPPAATPIPRSWWMAGTAAGLLSIVVLWKVCGGTEGPASSTSDEGDRIAALDGANDVDRHGADEDAANAGHQAEGGGGGSDRADGSIEENAATEAADEAVGGAATAEETEGDPEAANAGDEGAAADDEPDDDIDMEIDPDDVAGDGSGSSDAARGGGGSSTKPLPAGTQSADRAEEDAMSAEELLRAAKEAYAKGKARDAYRLANLSHQKQKSDDALQVKAKAACRMKNKDLAKSAYKSLPLGEKRRDVRQSCREYDVRLGL